MAEGAPSRLPALGAAQRAAVALGIILLIGVIAIGLRLGDLDAFFDQLRQAEFVWIALALAAQVLAFLALAVLWRLALRDLGAAAPLGFLLSLSVGKLFADQALPSGGISGAYFIVHALSRRGVSRDSAFTVFLFGAGGMVIMFILATVVSFLIAAARNASPAPLAIENAAVIMPVFVAFSAISVAGALRLPVVRRWIAKSEVAGNLTRLIRASAGEIAARRTLFGKAVVLQIVGRLFDVLTLWLCFQAIKSSATFDECFAAVAIAALAATVAPTPMGLGTFEGGMVAALTSFGVGVEAALASTLLYRGLSLWLPLSAGIVIVQREIFRLRTPNVTARSPP